MPASPKALLWVVNSLRCEVAVGLAGDVALEAADVAFVEALSGSTSEVVVGVWVVPDAGVRDGVERGVELPVGGAPMFVVVAGGDLERADAAESGESGLVADSVGVGLCGQDGGGADRSDAGQLEQRGVGLGDQAE
jgi:hypothetical protein